MARYVGYYIKDERLQIHDSSLLLKNSLGQGRQNSPSGMRGYRFRIVFYYKESLWQGKQNIA